MKALELDSPCSNLDGFARENESNNRFHPAKEPQKCGRSKACIASASPVKVGNRNRIGFLVRCGCFFSPNRPDGQDGHTVAETWLESLWRRLVLALLNQAESEHLIHRTNRKENDYSLNDGMVCWRNGGFDSRAVHQSGGFLVNPACGKRGFDSPPFHHSGNNGFLFFFTL
jgi:hypothetical protein